MPMSPSPPSGAARRGRTLRRLEIDADYRVVGFEEKPQHGNPMRSRFDPRMVSASMGIYIFNTDVLLDALCTRMRKTRLPATISARDIIPRCLNSTA